MQNHNLDDVQAPQEDNLNSQAVSEAPQEGQLLAGKFKSKEDLLDSVSSLVEKVEDRPLKPSETLSLYNKDVTELEQTYLGLERKFHNGVDQPQSQSDNEFDQAEAFLNDWASKNGFVRKSDIEAEQAEKQQLENYFAQNPSARGRQELIVKLASMPDFQSKSFADVDAYIQQSIGGSSSPKETRNIKLGQRTAEEPTLNDMSDEELAEYLSSGGQGSTLVRKGY